MSKKISLYLHSLANAGGAEKRLCSLANILSDKGYHIDIISWDKKNTKSFYFLSNKICWNKIEYKIGIINKIYRIFKIVKIFRTKKIKLFIGFVMPGNRSLVVASLLSNTKIIAAERNAASMYKIKYSLLSRYLSFLTLKLCNKIVVNFEDFNNINQYPIFLRNKIITINNPVEIKKKFAKPHLLNKNEFTILIVSRLDLEQKNLDKAIHAIYEIINSLKNWNVKIIGSGSDEEKIKLLINDLNLNHKINIIEPIDQNIEEYYISSHLFIIPSKWEGFSNALAEAMSYGLPVIGYKDSAGVNSFIRNDHNGWLAENNNAHIDLSKKIKFAIENHDLREIYGKNAISTIKQYNPSKSYEDWIKLINNI